MSPLVFLLILVIGIGILMFMMLKLKIHPVMALFFISIFFGLALGNPILKTMELINSGFGGTLTGIGITIIFGSILAMGVQDTGAATSMANFFIRLFKGKRLELAPSLTAFIMSIPVFGDITMVLTAPFASILARRKKINMTVMGAFTNLGLTFTHGLVPPTPGILAISIMLGADLGLVVFWGIIVSIVAFLVTYALTIKWLERSEFIEPREDFIIGIEEAAATAEIDSLTIREEGTPSAFASFLPLLIPAVLISIASFANMLLPKDSFALTLLTSIGDKGIALFAGVICVALLVANRKQKVVNSAVQYEANIDEKSSILEIVLNNWVARGLRLAILPLLITAMGGAMSNILKASPAAKELGNIVAASNVMPILIPFGIAAVMMAACGSMTMAAMTGAALVQPMMAQLGLSPVATALSIGAGSMMFWHINNSGFWVMTQFFHFDSKQGLKYLTTTTAIGGIFALIGLMLLNFAGII